MDAVEQWIQDNLMQCDRLSSRIQPSFCRAYRDNNPYCKGCSQWEEMDAAAEGRPIAAPLPITEDKHKEEEMSKKGTCRCCGKEGILQARGLIGACYYRHNKAGTLDQFPPITAKGLAIQAARQSEKAEEVETVSAPATPPAPVEEVPCVLESSEPTCFEDLFEGERDQEMLEKIRTIARTERRTVEAQILCLLEYAIEMQEAI